MDPVRNIMMYSFEMMGLFPFGDVEEGRGWKSYICRSCSDFGILSKTLGKMVHGGGPLIISQSPCTHYIQGIYRVYSLLNASSGGLNS